MGWVGVVTFLADLPLCCVGGCGYFGLALLFGLMPCLLLVLCVVLFVSLGMVCLGTLVACVEWWFASCLVMVICGELCVNSVVYSVIMIV